MDHTAELTPPTTAKGAAKAPCLNPSAEASAVKKLRVDESAARANIISAFIEAFGDIASQAETSARERIFEKWSKAISNMLMKAEQNARRAINAEMVRVTARWKLKTETQVVKCCLFEKPKNTMARCDCRAKAEGLHAVFVRVIDHGSNVFDKNDAKQWWRTWRIRYEQQVLSQQDPTATVDHIRGFNFRTPYGCVEMDFTSSLTARCIALKTTAKACSDTCAKAVVAALRSDPTAVTGITEVVATVKTELERTEQQQVHFSETNRLTGYGHNATHVSHTSPWQVCRAGDEMTISYSKKEFDCPYVVLCHTAATARLRTKVLFGTLHNPPRKIGHMVKLAANTLRRFRKLCLAKGFDGFIISADCNFHNHRKTFVKVLRERLAGTGVRVHTFLDKGEAALGAFSWKVGDEVRRRVRRRLRSKVSDHPNVTSLTFDISNVAVLEEL